VLYVEDLTDLEREEQLRRWWSENWLWIFGGIALGMALLWGWQYWQRSRLAQAQQDLTAYQAVITSLGQSKFDEAVAEARALRDRHPASPYADQSDLALARMAAEEQKLDVAAQHLRSVMDASKDPELRTVARSRLARVLIAQDKSDEAITLLDMAEAGAFAALYHELRGDAYAAKGDAAAARREYDEALGPQNSAAGLDRAYVELKRDQLPATPQPAGKP
jgi:predicted negative regulator of RcsB-dependent stress response